MDGRVPPRRSMVTRNVSESGSPGVGTGANASSIDALSRGTVVRPPHGSLSLIGSITAISSQRTTCALPM